MKKYLSHRLYIGMAVLILLGLAIIMARNARPNQPLSPIGPWQEYLASYGLQVPGLDLFDKEQQSAAALAIEGRKRAEKILHDQVELAKRPRYNRITFFLKGPVMASLALPATWEGKYATVETGREIILYCGNIASSSRLLSIAMISQDESGPLKNGDWKLLAEASSERFIYKIGQKKNQPQECIGFLGDTEQALESFKWEKQ